MPRWRGTTVAGVELDIAGDGAFEDPAERRDVVDGERGAVAAVAQLARAHAPGVANGERGTAAAVDDLARVHAPGVADGERGAATAAVLVVKLGRDCN